MLYTTHTFQTADELKLYREVRKPAGEPKAIIHFVHGMFEHSGRFTPTMEYLVRQGFAVCAYDQRGHGRSEGRRGDTPSYGHLIADLEMFFNLGKAAYPEHKHFLFGHSMGGALIANFALRKKPDIAGMIPSAPWFRVAMDVESWKQRLIPILIRLWPTYTEEGKVPLSYLTRDEREVEKYKHDKLMHTKITARFFMEAAASGEWAVRNAQKLSVPMFLYHGTSDYITSLSASKEFVYNAPSELVTFEELDGIYHDIYHDLGRDLVWQKMVEWLNSKC